MHTSREDLTCKDGRLPNRAASECFFPLPAGLPESQEQKGILMLVLGIYGSPRKAGNTDCMLDAFLEGVGEAGAQIRRIYVRNLKMNGCIGCGECDETGVCSQQDDMTALYPLLESAPRIVVASPVYFYGVSGQLKLLIDRSQALYMRRERDRRQLAGTGVDDRGGFLLSSGATRGKRLFECLTLTVKYFFDAVGVAYGGELCYREVEEKGDIARHPSALEECRRAGRDFAGNRGCSRPPE